MNYFTKEKHYNTLTNYHLKKYNKKVCKIPLNCNFTCPNKDGTKGFFGCSFCSKLGSGDFAGNVDEPIKTQFEKVKTMMNKKWSDTFYIPYLQANTNTYSSVDNLKRIYEEIITLDEGIVKLSIGTRCDALEDDKIAYLSQLNKRIPVSIELGLQTINSDTAKLINRGHDLKEFSDAVHRLRKENIEVIVHIINGLPYETKNMMIDTIKYLNTLDIQGIKIHSLVLIKDTKLYYDYLNNPFKILTLEEYVDIVVDQIRHLKENIIIHRLAADGKIEDLYLPKWTIKKLVVINEIDKVMRKNNYFQGDLYKE